MLLGEMLLATMIATTQAHLGNSRKTRNPSPFKAGNMFRVERQAGLNGYE